MQSNWKHNLYVLWFGNFMTGMGFSMTMPFMPLFVKSLGHFDTWTLNILSGVAFSITFLAKAIISPYWGKLADQYGRKLMCLRSSLGMTITITACGFVPGVGSLIVLRAIQGLFSGYINNANAIVAASAPMEVNGKAMGTLATGNVVGTLLGPLIGGVLAEAYGYRTSFYVVGAMMAVVFFVTLFFVHEEFTPIKREEMMPMKQVFHEMKYPKLIWGLFITTLVIQAANMSVTPILSLLVSDLLHHGGRVALVSGIISSLPGIVTLFTAPFLGALSDKYGPEKILTGGLILAVMTFSAMSFVTNVYQLGVWRAVLGISDAALLPAVQSLMVGYVPKQAFGRIFSWNQSFQAMGSVVGPMLGSVVASIFAYQSVFMMTAIMEIFNFIFLFPIAKAIWQGKKQQKRVEA